MRAPAAGEHHDDVQLSCVTTERREEATVFKALFFHEGRVVIENVLLKSDNIFSHGSCSR